MASSGTASKKMEQRLKINKRWFASHIDSVELNTLSGNCVGENLKGNYGLTFLLGKNFSFI